jgi:hypothetical protein
MNELALTFFILGSGCSLAIPLVQLAALRERLHAPARFKVTVRESLATQDSVTSEIPANPTSF